MEDIEMTNIIRDLLSDSTKWVETKNAESSLINISYQSRILPERHVWISVYDILGIDLEDWENGTTWDDSVARFTATDYNTIALIAKAWLEGETLEYCTTLGGSKIDIR